MTTSEAWRPIESAPVRKRVLLYQDGDIYAGRRDGKRSYWQSFCGQPVVWTPEPTHWMPLPNPPEQVKS